MAAPTRRQADGAGSASGRRSAGPLRHAGGSGGRGQHDPHRSPGPGGQRDHARPQGALRSGHERASPTCRSPARRPRWRSSCWPGCCSAAGSRPSRCKPGHRPAHLPPGRYGGRPGRAHADHLYPVQARPRHASKWSTPRGRWSCRCCARLPRAAGDHQFFWDGGTLQGEFAAPGKYLIQAQARTATSTVSASAPITITRGERGRAAWLGTRLRLPIAARRSGAPPPRAIRLRLWRRANVAGVTDPLPPERNVLRGDRG